MTSIGIVGTGISGLTLALTLQQAGVDTTLYAEKTPDETRAGRLPNTVVRFGPTIACERALGVEHWDNRCVHRQLRPAGRHVARHRHARAGRDVPRGGGRSRARHGCLKHGRRSASCSTIGSSRDGAPWVYWVRLSAPKTPAVRHGRGAGALWERGVVTNDPIQAKGTRMTSIGIVGTGISGLQLALTLQRRGVDTTVYAEKTPDEMRAGRLPNSVVRFARTIERERALGAPHWLDSASARLDSMHVSILDTPVAFVGQLEQPASGVDFRVYLPRLLEDYADRGGRVVLGARSPEDVVAGVDDHDLTVVASGRDSVDAFFPRDEARSPYSAPQRRLCVMHVHGIAPLDPAGASFSIAPGVGEIFTFPFLSALGSVTCLAVEAIPGGPLEPITRVRYDEDPAAFEAQMLELLERFAPAMLTRIDRAEFGVTGPLDLLQGALTPVVRRPYCEVAPGRFVVAVGDAYVTNDPICGQGANLGSTNAAILADAICLDVAFDDWFCRGLARDMWAAAESVTTWNNSFLMPPPPHVEAILGAAAQSPAVADAFSNMWADPAAMWRAIATPDRAAAFLASVGAPQVALTA